ncbi:DUF21 domain-containing protein [Sesbania bispinosa]|nr:DUF21 domain-containing protein [Sesbania bispinosa]
MMRQQLSVEHLILLKRVPSDMPLYDILNEFQKGSSHMVVVVMDTLIYLSHLDHDDIE